MTDDTTRREQERDRLSAGMAIATDAVRMLSKGATFETIRGDLATARQTVRLAASGADYADLDTAAGLIDAALQGLCPHDPATHYTAYADSGEELTTCTACNVSWFTGRRYGEGQS